MGQIAQERKDDSAKREAAVTASMEQLKLHQETLFRHAERTANAARLRGLPGRWPSRSAFRPSCRRFSDERKKAMVAKIRAALSRAKGLGDLKSVVSENQDVARQAAAPYRWLWGPASARFHAGTARK